MKKLIGVIAILLVIVLSVIYRQLTGRPAGSDVNQPTPELSAAGAVQENLLLASLIIQ